MKWGVRFSEAKVSEKNVEEDQMLMVLFSSFVFIALNKGQQFNAHLKLNTPFEPINHLYSYCSVKLFSADLEEMCFCAQLFSSLINNFVFLKKTFQRIDANE